jgi:hypothetical protein
MKQGFKKSICANKTSLVFIPTLSYISFKLFYLEI